MDNTFIVEGHPRWRIPRIVIPFLPLPVAAAIVALVFATLANEIVTHSPHARAEAHTHWTQVATDSPLGKRMPTSASGSPAQDERVSTDPRTQVRS